MPYEVYEEIDLVSLLEGTARFLWKEWPLDMEIVTVNPHEQFPSQGGFTMRGTCPHCHKGSGFLPRGAAFRQNHNGVVRWILMLECQTCTKFILAIAMQPHTGNQNHLVYATHYPLGEPDDTVAPEIPAHIQEDFKEALRCQFVDAWNATAEMCRRAIEASCIDLGVPVAKIRVLEDMIDWLEGERKITPFLKEVAHKIRLGGNRGAHPPEAGAAAIEVPGGPVIKIGKDHAEAIVQFTREFFHHVYVVPKQLDKYDFSKPKVPKP